MSNEQNQSVVEEMPKHVVFDLSYERFGTWNWNVLSRRGRPQIHFKVEFPKLNEHVIQNGVSKRGRPLFQKNKVESANTAQKRGPGRPTLQESFQMIMDSIKQDCAEATEHEFKLPEVKLLPEHQ